MAKVEKQLDLHFRTSTKWRMGGMRYHYSGHDCENIKKTKDRLIVISIDEVEKNQMNEYLKGELRKEPQNLAHWTMFYSLCV